MYQDQHHPDRERGRARATRGESLPDFAPEAERAGYHSARGEMDLMDAVVPPPHVMLVFAIPAILAGVFVLAVIFATWLAIAMFPIVICTVIVNVRSRAKFEAQLGQVAIAWLAAMAALYGGTRVLPEKFHGFDKYFDIAWLGVVWALGISIAGGVAVAQKSRQPGRFAIAPTSVLLATSASLLVMHLLLSRGGSHAILAWITGGPVASYHLDSRGFVDWLIHR